MILLILAIFYLAVAACEIAFTDKSLFIFEKIVSNKKLIRLIGILSVAVASLYAISKPHRIGVFINALFWIYLISGISFLIGAQLFVGLFRENFTHISLYEKKLILYADCAFRTIIGVILIYAI